MSRVCSTEDNRRVARLLHDLCRAVRDGVLEGRQTTANWETIERISPSDTIYRIDKISEEALIHWFESNWPEDLPADLIGEGLGDETGQRFPEAAPESRLTILIDPIDGTRGLMYDKRSAWVLAGAAWNSPGRQPCLSNLCAGAMAEIPVTKQRASDSLCGWQTEEGAFMGEAAREDNPGLRPTTLHLRPSQAKNLYHGFASFVSFFPEGREEIARIEQAFLSAHTSGQATTSPLVFTDQYISSGGQIYEILAGRDRMVADLRPLVFEKLKLPTPLCCHPYDLACLPAARATGCIFEDPWGRPLASPLDTTTPIAWVGYANQELAELLRPLLISALESNGYSSSTSK